MNTSSVNRTKIDLQFPIELEGPLAIWSGFRRGQIQRTVLRSSHGEPFIPASTLKGRVRDAAERLARTLGHKICGAPDPDDMCGNGSSCLVCRTFGSPGISALSGHTGLIWRDAKLIDERGDTAEIKREEADALYYARTQVQLSRLRGTAQEQHLFTSETTIENLRFRGRIRGWLPVVTRTAGKFPEELVLLCSALRLLTFVGGSKSRGAGLCKISLPANLELNDKPTPINEILEEISYLQRSKEKS